MAHVDFTATPLPSNGTARSASALAAIFNNLKTVSDGHDDILSGLATAATALVAATPSILVSRDTNAAIFGGQFAATATSLSQVAVQARAFSSTPQFIWAGQSGGGSPATTSTIDSAGNAIFNGNVTAAAFLGGAAQPFTATILDLKVVPSVVAATLTMKGNGTGALSGVRDSNGNVIGTLTDKTITMPTQPTGTNFQYVGLSLPPGATGATAVTVTAGTLDAAESDLVIPLVNTPLASVLWPGATTLPSGIIPAANIRDMRFGGGGGGGGGGGTTDSALRAVATLVNGPSDPTVHPNTLDVTDTAGVAIIVPNRVKGLASITNPFVQYDLGSVTHYYASGTAVNFNASAVGTSPGPLTIAKGALVCTNTALVSGTATGAAGTRYIIADCTGGATWSLVSPLPSSLILTGNQVWLGTIYWDGTNLWTQSANFSPAQNLNSIQVGKQTYHASAATVSGLTSTTYATPSLYTAAPFPVATVCKARITNVVDVVNSSGTGTFQVGARIQPVTGGGGMLTGNYAVFKQFGVAVSSEYTGTMVTEITLQPGSYILDQQYLVTGTCSLALSASSPFEAWVELWAGA